MVELPLAFCMWNFSQKLVEIFRTIPVRANQQINFNEYPSGYFVRKLQGLKFCPFTTIVQLHAGKMLYECLQL